MEQTEQQKKVSLIPYLMKYKWHYLAGIVLLLVVDLANLYVPRYMGDIIDGLTEGAFGMEGVIPLLWKILAAGAAMMVGRFGWRYFIFGAARGIEYRLRDDMFSHLETLSARYFNSHKTGDLMAHFTNDLQAVRMAVGPAVVTVFDAVVMTVMVLFQMVVYVDLQLTVLAFVPLTLVAVGCYFYGIEAKKRQTRRQEAFSSLSDKVQESLSGVRVLKAFVQEEEDFKAFARASENVKEKNLAVVKLRAVFGPSLDAVTGISLLLTLIFGGKMVLAGTISVGQFVAFTTYISMLVWPMIACGDCINMFSQASAAFQRISCIFREEPDIVDREGIPEGEDVKIRGELTLKDLTFTYPDGEEPVLQSVNLHVKAGEMLGILGRTGSGKSSLADLLLRVYDCQEGSLLVDGRPITEFPLAVLHRDMAYVPQDNFLFSDTLEENIAFGLEERISQNPELRQRIKEGRIVEFDQCRVSHTVALEDETFCYCTLENEPALAAYLESGRKAQEEAKRKASIEEDPDESLEKFFVSSLPWLSYTALIQPVPSPADSNPRITFGKYFTQGERVLMPVTLLCNHALVDGRHIAAFYHGMERELAAVSAGPEGEA